jgi:hypothetical protein
MKYSHFDTTGKLINLVEWDGKTPFKVDGTLVPHEPAHDIVYAKDNGLMTAEAAEVAIAALEPKKTLWQRFLAFLGLR